MMRTDKTFCRLCPAHCEMILTIDEDDRIVRLKGDKDNPAWLHPDDLALSHLKSGDRVEIVSDHGHIPAIVESDPTVRPGVVQVSYSWSSEAGGACTNLLISTDHDVEPINSMARLSAIPVNIVLSNRPDIERS